MRRDVLLEVSYIAVDATSCSTSCVLVHFVLFIFIVIHSFIFALPIGSFTCCVLLAMACCSAVDTVLVRAVGEALCLVFGTLFVPFLCFSLSHFSVSLLCRLFSCVPECVTATYDI